MGLYFPEVRALSPTENQMWQPYELELSTNVHGLKVAVPDKNAHNCILHLKWKTNSKDLVESTQFQFTVQRGQVPTLAQPKDFIILIQLNS